MKQRNPLHRYKYNNQDVEFADPRIVNYSNEGSVPSWLKEKKYTPKAGRFRIRLLEGPYKWWIRCSQDFKNATIPISLCIGFTWLIYSSSVYLYEREQKQKFRAQIPEHLDQREQFKEYQKKRKEQQMQQQ